ncbi:MAG: TIGR02221 family CRISPR-associated protein [Rikenellaceae bacterium]|nr:TIGR02221 family CRISPR-associated protein [Rikenellaceae bacterium]
MAKVLISFLGTGRIKKVKKGNSSREYEPTNYRIGKKDYECTFVSIALRKHLKIKKLILIGTTHSMWEEVYRVYTQREDNIWFEIGDTCDKNNYKSELTIPHKEKIEAAMGKGSQAILVKYGITAEEIQQNSEIILGLENSLKEGDELYVDITHSFRSLPLYIMNLLVYLRDVSSKKIKISGIYYGMLEATSDLGYTPIVDLSDVLNVSSWISGAYSFMEFGNADKIAELVRSIDSNLCADLLQFSNTKNLNHLAELERQSQKLSKLLQQSQLPSMARMLIVPIIGDFVQRLSVDEKSPYRHSKFQSKLARWQFNNKNYLAAYISLQEAIITYHAEAYQVESGVDIDVYDKNKRDAIKDKLNDRNDMSISKEWKKLSRNVSLKRNALAHNTKKEYGPKKINVTQSFIDSLKSFLGSYERLANNQ